MANKDMFADRSPCLPAAGLESAWRQADMYKVFEHEVTEKDNPVEGLPPRSAPAAYPLPKSRADIYRGFDSDVRRCVQPDTFGSGGMASTLDAELKDTVYSSYWRLPLGRTADQVDCMRTMALLDSGAEFPEMPRVVDVPEEYLHFETTNQIAQKYRCDPLAESKTSVVARAGSAPRPGEDLGAILTPSVFTALDVRPAQLFAPRPPHVVRALAEKLGVTDDTEFDRVWSLVEDENGCASIQRFFDAVGSKK